MAATTSSLVAVAVLLASVAALTAASSSSSFGILDWFSWDDVLDYDASPASNSPQQRNGEGLVSERNCLCEGPSCNCCLDFNFTYVDLGGPALTNADTDHFYPEDAKRSTWRNVVIVDAS